MAEPQGCPRAHEEGGALVNFKLWGWFGFLEREFARLKHS